MSKPSKNRSVKKENGNAKTTMAQSKIFVSEKTEQKTGTANGKKSASKEIALEKEKRNQEGFKFVLGQSDHGTDLSLDEMGDLGDLPASYGTKKVFLMARDPHWYYAYWDLTETQYSEAVQQACDGKIFLQLYTPGGNRTHQVQIPAGVKSWFVYTGAPGGAFYAELGYYATEGKFEILGRSSIAAAPKDYVSPNAQPHFVTIPFNFSFKELLEMIAGHTLTEKEMVLALVHLQHQGMPMPFDVGVNTVLTEEQQQELMGYLGGEIVRRMNMGSFEVTEILRQRLYEQMSSGVTSWSSAAMPTSMSMGSFGVSSFSLAKPMGASFGASRREAAARGFHMHVNAELIIYGGTDPNATVRVDGKTIKLREDGSFSYHFTFPDGRYFVPVEATSPDGVETRSAMLSFLRMSDYEGDVRKTGQNQSYNPPMGRQ